MAELKLPTWELAKEIADMLPPKAEQPKGDDKKLDRKGCR